ncbi:MAG: LuxR C-terminal-related transcriptional regulator [Chloroflexota bacterium]
MPTPILATKLYVPPLRPKVVLRPQLIERLNAGLNGRLTLISAPAGFGKTTLVSEWVINCDRPVVWLSLDEGDNDLPRFLTYLIVALQTVAPHFGESVLGVLQSPQPPPAETILTTLLNEMLSIPDNFILVLDDYHVIDAKPVDNALIFLLEHLPPQMHLVIATREDPYLPLARFRARSQLTELRVADLRFTPAEAAGFLNQVMGLTLSTEDVDALETRTEGWVAGLQLAAISLQGHPDAARFIKSFTGNHRFVLDYLLEEVLNRQPENVQTFLLRTSILNRLCGSLCDAVMLDGAASAQETLAYLEHANLFIIPLDNERRWYRYHHLFADLLRQRLQQQIGDDGETIAELHRRASLWYEVNGLAAEAFYHAVATQDVDHVMRLMEGREMPLTFHDVAAPIVRWLESLPTAVLDAHPSLWVMSAKALLVTGQVTNVEPHLQAAEALMQGIELDEKSHDLVGQIAAARATLALSQYQVEAVIVQSRRALQYLHPDNLPMRTVATWTLGFAYQQRGERAAARSTYSEAVAISAASGNRFVNILASIGLGNIQESENQLYLAAETYQRSLEMVGNQLFPAACEAHLGLARILYEWNDLEAAQQHGQQSIYLARQYDSMIDRYIVSEIFLARLKLAQGDVMGAAASIAVTDQSVREHHFVYRIPEVAAVQVLILLRQGNLTAATELAQAHDLPISQARVYLAQGDPSGALALLEPLRRQMDAIGWADERLKLMVLQSVALYAQGKRDVAVQVLGEALMLAEPEGFIRIFVDEGPLMAQLLTEAAARGIMPDYSRKLLAAFELEAQSSDTKIDASAARALIEPLSQRELEVLQLIAQGLSNHEISERLFLALSTVKGHNQKIFDKLQVQRRTEAIARARDLGLL